MHATVTFTYMLSSHCMLLATGTMLHDALYLVQSLSTVKSLVAQCKRTPVTTTIMHCVVSSMSMLAATI